MVEGGGGSGEGVRGFLSFRFKLLFFVSLKCQYLPLVDFPSLVMVI